MLNQRKMPFFRGGFKWTTAHPQVSFEGGVFVVSEKLITTGNHHGSEPKLPHHLGSPNCFGPSTWCLAVHKDGHSGKLDLLSLTELCIYMGHIIWVLPKIGVPQNGWFIMEKPLLKMDDLGVPLFFGNIHIYHLERIDGATPISLGLSWPLDEHSPPVGSYAIDPFTTVYILYRYDTTHPPEPHFQNFRASNVLKFLYLARFHIWVTT